MSRGLKALLVFLAPFLLAAGCETLPAARHLDSPAAPPAAAAAEFVLPEPSWPLRIGEPARLAPPAAAAVWLPPSPPDPAGLKPVPAAQPALPLPDVRAVPVRQTPVSRSWGQTQSAPAKGTAPLVPSVPPAALAAKETPKTAGATPKDPKADAKPPVAAVPVPAVKTPAAAPATAAAKASLLPADQTVGADFQWQEVNAAAGDLVTLHFDRSNWLYLDTPAQQKAVGFQSISRDKDATTFQFKPPAAGKWVLEFQRQDLAAGTSEGRKVNLTVGAAGTRTTSTGTAQAPQTSTAAANTNLEAARQLAASGKTAEAVKKLMEGYKADDARTNLELARLLSQTGQDDQALDYLGKNLDLPGPDFQGTLELGTKLAALKDPQKKLPAYVKLWLAGTAAPPEDLFVQVFEALRTQKLGTQAREWAGRYASWYPAAKLRDKYLFQYGLLLEEPGEGRDVRGAWRAYDEIVRNFPLSGVWKAAGDRAAYLNRTFLQVR